MKYAIIMCCLLSACCTPEVSNPVIVPQKQTVELPSDLLVYCPPLPKLTKTTYTEGESVDIVNSMVKMTELCRSTNAILIDTIKDAFNIKLVEPKPKPVVPKVQPSK